jgi:hypothetical protein
MIVSGQDQEGGVAKGHLSRMSTTEPRLVLIPENLQFEAAR